MRGRVVNKHARYNICYSDVSQEPDFENGRGRIVSFGESKYLSDIRNIFLPHFFGEKAKGLNAEGNKYFDISKCGIGFHGDSERRIVIAMRLGESMNLKYWWYRKSERVGDPITVSINHSDVYIMSEKAVGTDWKKRNIYTLRHAAGCEKYTK